MIKVNGLEIKPTRFPDGTSQIWNLPKQIFEFKTLNIVWYYEAEREIYDLLSFRKLLGGHPAFLYIPYLPFARQDKPISNDSTFNLQVFADLVNLGDFSEVSAFDVHNASAASQSIKSFSNVPPLFPILHAIEETYPDYLVFPDEGAAARYLSMINFEVKSIIFKKSRDQKTGAITEVVTPDEIKGLEGKCFLIVDDICDGGTTFIGVARAIQRVTKDSEINLYVSHGIFSRGKDPLLKAGIKKIFTTKSLLKNADGYQV